MEVVALIPSAIDHIEDAFRKVQQEIGSRSGCVGLYRHLSRNAVSFPESGVGMNGAACEIGNLFAFGP
jgi:hypothetical protein